jgi:Na+/H+ antiporter NhaD/arsenite permease-like protein
VFEEQLHLRKSKPVMLAAGLIWVIIAIAYNIEGNFSVIKPAIEHNFLEYSQLFFFLLLAMTYINAMLECCVIDVLSVWLVAQGYSYGSLFWLTGILAFFISPVADNLATALIMCAVVLAVGDKEPRLVTIACINIVVAF